MHATDIASSHPSDHSPAPSSPDGPPARSARPPEDRSLNGWGLPPLAEVVCVDELEVVLREADEPLSARQIRRAMGIHRAYLSMEVTKFLHVAVRSGRVLRAGNSSGTRYRAA